MWIFDQVLPLCSFVIHRYITMSPPLSFFTSFEVALQRIVKYSIYSYLNVEYTIISVLEGQSLKNWLKTLKLLKNKNTRDCQIIKSNFCSTLRHFNIWFKRSLQSKQLLTCPVMTAPVYLWGIIPEIPNNPPW